MDRKEARPCRLCGEEKKQIEITGKDGREHFFCGTCSLINTREKHFLSQDEERARYELHENGPHDERYKDFLMQAAGPAFGFLSKGMKALDYGCGPGPTLSGIVKERGFDCEDYDPFFLPDLPGKTYDLIFATEVMEHCFRPREEITNMISLLKRSGMMVLMTERWKDLSDFYLWQYATDPTHVCFYHSETFSYIMGTFGFQKIYDDGKRVTILKKSS